MKWGFQELAPSLVRLFNYSLVTCQIPNIWKTAHVIPIFKKGDKQEVSNYRPVSLLSVVSKCFEKIIFKHMFNFLSMNNILTQWQSGFTPGDSTVKHLITLYHLLADAIDHKKYVRIVFCDISSAFDRVWHQGLLYKLECVGISGHLLSWFKNYLSGRYQQVVIQGQTSTLKQIQAGVPQGSVLGPLLFLVFINDLPDYVQSEIRLFADDTILFKIFDDMDQAANELNHDLNSAWAKKWLVTFNPAKTESLFVSTKHNVMFPPLYFGGGIVKEVTAHKQLGVILSSNLSWNEHIDDICLKASKRLDILRALKYKLSRQALKLIYLSFIHPIIEYGDVLFDDCGVINNTKLNKIQYEAAKIVSGAM